MSLKQQLHSAILSHALLTAETSQARLRKPNGDECRWLLDLRRIFLRGDGLELAAKVFWNLMAQRMPFQVGGLELGAVPLVAAILTEGRRRGHDITGFIGRKSRKKSGACQQIEGEVSGQPIVLVDDVINSGQSIRKLVLTLEEIGRRPRELFVLVDFNKADTHRWLAEQGIGLHAVFDLAEFGLSARDEPRLFPVRDTLEIARHFSPPDPNHVFVCPRSTPVLDRCNAYYGADNGCFYAVDLASGRLVGEFKTGGSVKGIFSSPALWDEKVIFGAYDGTVYCLDTRSGGVVWRYDAADWVGSSPAVAEGLGLVFIGLEHAIAGRRGSLVALDLYTGACRWEFVLRQYLHGTPSYCPELGVVAIGTNDSALMLLDASSGQLRWQFDTGGPIKAAPAFDLERQQVVFGCHDGGCYGVDITSGEETFRFMAENVIYNTPLVVGERLFIGSTDKSLYVYDLNAKELVAKVATQGRIFSHPALINGHVWFGSNDGCIRQIDPLSLELVGGIHLTERVLTRIEYSPQTGCYYAVTDGNRLLALREK